MNSGVAEDAQKEEYEEGMKSLREVARLEFYWIRHYVDGREAGEGRPHEGRQRTCTNSRGNALHDVKLAIRDRRIRS